MMNRMWIGAMGAIMALAPLTQAQAQDQKPSPVKSEAKRSGMSDDMRQAIEWERAKDRAAARQARIEARHPGDYREADRTADRSTASEDTGRKVKDTKAPGAKRDQ